jgi:hypothetical protein
LPLVRRIHIALTKCAGLLALALACTPHPASINGPGRGEGPGLWSDQSAAATETYATYGVRPRTITEPETPYTAPLPYLPTGTPTPTASITESGSRCLSELRKTKVAFAPLRELPGVKTPVEIRGPLGGVEYWVVGSTPLQMDCRLALTLSKVGAVLARHGVTRVRFSGAYVYKTTPSGRLSHHAHGLAIDLHDFTFGRRTESVKQAFSRNVGCQEAVPALNRLACDLRATSYFDEFLTPDYNAAHRDHLHVSVPRG